MLTDNSKRKIMSGIYHPQDIDLHGRLILKLY
jgi:hypothetical protein